LTSPRKTVGDPFPKVAELDGNVAPSVAFGEMDMRTSIRPTVAQVDLGAIRRNLALMSRLVGDAAVLAVIKADAYGHGAVPVARSLAGRCAALAVSLVEEGLELRAAGIAQPILVLGAFYDRCHGQVLDQQLTPVIYDAADLESFSLAAVARARVADVHLKVDTGMSRLGIAPGDLPAALDRAATLPGIRIAGLCTHLASADVPFARDTAAALTLFRGCVDLARAKGLGPIMVHAANSAAAVRFADARFDAVRPGLALFGAMPSAFVALPGLEPALRFATRVMAVRRIPAGTAVSYGALWRAQRPSRIGTLPVGYADGYPRHVRSAEVIVRGRRVPLVGAVCMDMMMVDLTDVPGAEVGDPVTLLGADGAASIAVDELAGWAGTINYEILCGISKRVPRIYKES
jgi:alanine racemase